MGIKYYILFSMCNFFNIRAQWWVLHALDCVAHPEHSLPLLRALCVTALDRRCHPPPQSWLQMLQSPKSPHWQSTEKREKYYNNSVCLVSCLLLIFKTNNRLFIGLCCLTWAGFDITAYWFKSISSTFFATINCPSGDESCSSWLSSTTSLTTTMPDTKVTPFTIS